MLRKQIVCAFISILIVVGLLTGCNMSSSESNTPKLTYKPAVSASMTPEPPPPRVLNIEAMTDISVAAEDLIDPSSEISKYLVNIYHPDKELYNAVFRAVQQHEEQFDMTAFDLPFEQKVRTVECLYSETGFRFYYLDRVKCYESENGQFVNFKYTDDIEQIGPNLETFYARLSHLLHNVAPEDGTDMQKYFAMFQYLCDHADYTPDISDITTINPYSIINKGVGTCGGFAILMEYVLSRAGLTIEYVCNEAHAWNMIQLNDKWYHSDVTFCIGSAGSYTDVINTILMDDETRKSNLAENGVEPVYIILGYPHDKTVLPPACTDTGFLRYSSIYESHALDIKNSRIYFSDMGYIKAMDLDCTDEQTLTEDFAADMVWFDGALYYLSGYDGSLYKLVPGLEKELIDNDEWYGYLTRNGSVLNYSPGAEDSEFKALPLLSPNTSEITFANKFESFQMPRSRSFKLDIEFSEPMDTSADWNRFVYLTDDNNNAIPLQFVWNKDGKTLSVRPVDLICDYSGVTISVMSDSPAASGRVLGLASAMHIDIVSEF